ncbi:MAG: alpha/beta fold hydrolase [Pseudonocardiaceae bacterium]
MQPTTVASNGIEIAYETFGAPGDRPLLLVMGVGAQMLAWHPELCAALAAEGFFVVRYDNRDVGLSTHLHDAPPPNLGAAMGGDFSSASYRLEDMADDAVGLLDALRLDRAQVVGASLGGMIAQTMAIMHPDRVRSLTSIMSTPGVGIGSATPAAQAAFAAPPPASRAEVVEWIVTILKIIGSPGYPMDEVWVREVAGQSYDRGFDPAGVDRQGLAIYASGDRTAALAGVTTPTLVVHGEADPLIQLPGGRATAAALPNAELLVLPGMGHDLPRGIWPTLVAAISRLADRAEVLHN